MQDSLIEPELPFPAEKSEEPLMDPLQQEVVALFERFCALHSGYQAKIAGPKAQGKAKDWRAQQRIDELFLARDFLRKTGENPRKQPYLAARTRGLNKRFDIIETHCPHYETDFLGERAIRQRLQWFMQTMEAKLAQMEDNDRFAERRYPTQREWRRSPRHFLKTVQEALCDPADTILFNRHELNNPGGLSNAMRFIILSPERINDTLLKNLGLDDFIPQPATPNQRVTTVERLQYYTDAIPEIRRMLLDIEFIRRPDERRHPVGDLRYFRMMRIGEGADPDNPNPYAGFILGTQMNNGHRTLFRTDLHGADRRLLHIEHGANAELEKLHTIIEALDAMERHPDAWRGFKNAEKRDELLVALENIIEDLEHVRDRHKKSLRRNLIQYMKQLNNENPGAATWARERCRTNLGERIRDMEAISGELAKDAKKVQGLIHREEMPYHTFLKEVESLKDEFADPARFDPETMRARLAALKTHITQTMIFEPHRSVGKQCLAGIDQTLTALGNDDGAAANSAFLRVYFITKMERAYYKVTKANRELVERGVDDADPHAVLARLTRIYNELREHALAPDEKDDQLRDPYIRLYEWLREMRFILGDLLQTIQPDIDRFRPEQTDQAVQLDLPEGGTNEPVETDEPASKPDPDSSPHTRSRGLHAIFARTKAGLRNFLEKALHAAKGKLRRTPAQPAASQPDLPLKPIEPPFTLEEKTNALAQVRRLMSDFPFTEFIRGL